MRSKTIVLRTVLTVGSATVMPLLATPSFSAPLLAASSNASAQNGTLVAAASSPQTAPAPTAVAGADQLAQAGTSATVQQLIQENRELKQRLERLEALMGVKASAPMPLLPKDGFYVQGDIGYQQRLVAGEDGYTYTQFNPGFSGSAGVGYRYNKNWRFSGEFANLSSTAKTLAGPIDQWGTGYTILGTVSPITSTATGNPPTFSTTATPNTCPGQLCVAPNNFVAPGQATSGATPIFPTQAPFGSIVLNQYTLNAYYDLPGFGNQGRFRPYLGLGVGAQKSSIVGLGFPGSPIVNSSTWAPLITFDAGLNYLVSSNTEVYAGAKYALGSELWFQNTAFGNLLPQSSRNWILKTGIRYTF